MRSSMRSERPARSHAGLARDVKCSLTSQHSRRPPGRSPRAMQIAEYPVNVPTSTANVAAGEEREGGQQRSLVGTHLHPGGTPQLRRVGAQVVEHGIGLRDGALGDVRHDAIVDPVLVSRSHSPDATQNFGGRCRYRFGR